MNNDEFLPMDWPHPEQPSSTRGADAASSNDAPFSAALARLFNASVEANAPPRYLRALLALERWRPIPLPEPDLCAAATARTRAFVPARAGGAPSRKKKKHGQSALIVNVHITCAFEAIGAEALAADALDARHVLQTLPESINLVLLQLGAELYGFNRPQCQALQAHYQQLAEQSEATRLEQHDLQLLTGAGTLAEFLTMKVRAPAALKASSAAEGKVLDLQTLGFRSYRSDGVVLSLHELVHALDRREDFDGVQFNRPHLGKAVFEFGPNFATWCLRGMDPRHACPCPAQDLREIAIAPYATRRFTRIDAAHRATLSEVLLAARNLLSAIPHDQSALPRAALISFDGARALRQSPEVGQRRWLTDIIARLEWALKARWRIGVF